MSSKQVSICCRAFQNSQVGHTDESQTD